MISLVLVVLAQPVLSSARSTGVPAPAVAVRVDGGYMIGGTNPAGMEIVFLRDDDVLEQVVSLNGFGRLGNAYLEDGGVAVFVGNNDTKVLRYRTSSPAPYPESVFDVMSDGGINAPRILEAVGGRVPTGDVVAYSVSTNAFSNPSVFIGDVANFVQVGHGQSLFACGRERTFALARQTLPPNILAVGDDQFTVTNYPGGMAQSALGLVTGCSDAELDPLIAVVPGEVISGPDAGPPVIRSIDGGVLFESPSVDIVDVDFDGLEIWVTLLSDAGLEARRFTPTGVAIGGARALEFAPAAAPRPQLLLHAVGRGLMLFDPGTGVAESIVIGLGRTGDGCISGAQCISGRCAGAACAVIPNDPDAGADAGSDAGTADAGASDAGASDAGVSDASVGDSGVSDSGVSDSGVSDSGVSDSGASDSGVSDSGVSDSGVSDSGMSDAGASDSGAPDSGAIDAGAGDPLSTGVGCNCQVVQPSVLVLALVVLLRARRRRA